MMSMMYIVHWNIRPGPGAGWSCPGAVAVLGLGATPTESAALARVSGGSRTTGVAKPATWLTAVDWEAVENMTG